MAENNQIKLNTIDYNHTYPSLTYQTTSNFSRNNNDDKLL